MRVDRRGKQAVSAPASSVGWREAGVISFERRDSLSPSVIVFIFIPRRSHRPVTATIKGKGVPLHISRGRLLSSRDRQSEWRRADGRGRFSPSLSLFIRARSWLATLLQTSQANVHKVSRESFLLCATFVGRFTVERLISLNKRTRTVRFFGGFAWLQILLMQTPTDGFF